MKKINRNENQLKLKDYLQSLPFSLKLNEDPNDNYSSVKVKQDLEEKENEK